MIEVQGLHKHYSSRSAIVDLTFSVPRGQVLGFLGPDGAGKSTTMRILAGCLGATAGTASVAGYDVFKQSRAARRCIGYLPETAPLFTEMRVGAYLHTMCRLRGMAPARRRSRVGWVLPACGLAAQKEAVIGHLSRGLRARVGLAQAVVHDPGVLLLDEPTAGLEPIEAAEIRELVRTLCVGRTVILSTRVLAEVKATCERVLVISSGALIADDSPDTLSRRVRGKPGRQVDAVIAGDPAKIGQRLRRLAGITEVLVVSRTDGEHQLTVTGTADDMENAVAGVIVREGVALRGLNSHSLALEDVFRELGVGEAS